MTDETEDLLAAWLDGALSPEEAARFETRLEREPDLAAKAAEWNANDAFIAKAFSAVSAAPIDAAMLDRLGLAEPPAMPVAANDNPPWWRRPGLAIGGGALAAGLALVLVLTGRPQGATDQDPLAFALDTTPSLHKARLPDGTEIEPLVTVRAGDGRWCREYRSAGDIALACRSAKGWEEVGRARGAGPDTQAQDVALAAGTETGPLDPAYDRIGAGDPIGADQEAGLIKAKWQ